MTQWTPVVAAIIREKSNTVGPRKFLLGLRPANGVLGGLWEFPGGKIEQNELPLDALKREIKEELGIEILDPQIKLAHSYSHKDRSILLLFYEVTQWQGDLKNLVHDELNWCVLEDMFSLPIPDGNKLALPELKEILCQRE